jgi:hypothetical protein
MIKSFIIIIIVKVLTTTLCKRVKPRLACILWMCSLIGLFGALYAKMHKYLKLLIVLESVYSRPYLKLVIIQVKPN